MSNNYGRGIRIVNRLQLGILEDSLMTEHTKQAIRCIDKRCKGIRCRMVKVPKGDVKTLLGIIEEGKLDAVALDLATVKKLGITSEGKGLNGNIELVSLVRDVDNRYVLMTRKKSGKHFSSPLVVSPGGNISSQLQEMFDGVTCVSGVESVNEQIEKLKLEQCDGVIASRADIIKLGCDRISKIRYQCFDDDVIVPDLGEGIIAVLCRKNYPYIETLKKAHNKRIAKELSMEKHIRKQIYNCFKDVVSAWERSVFNVSVRVRINKDRLNITVYVNEDGKGRYIRKHGVVSDREQLVAEVLYDVRSSLNNSNVF